MQTKNTTEPSVVQLPKLRPCEFGPDYTDLFRINPDADLIGALGVAADLADGASQLSGRLAYAINDGELSYLSEVRALGFLSDVVGALVRSAERGLRKAREDQGEGRP
ncbi:hypothetical protein [Pseudomonas chlororaphis]|uniref:hypothetical protein n=1 Tax=Pseudomonas chlororaphis TaxID=587753 RepID=UPI001B305F99|nr:hypothetical protein [Pseudomonas chlororaphis]MBP5054349.1 hypothetical protein [Pseudomonas chlororaphis]MBP5140287.1 hypothetical protein [Pseudomonas chlororaphis]QTT99526.1 hypothetical protein HUT26_09655 [Pseudomonas chlororaphis]